MTAVRAFAGALAFVIPRSLVFGHVRATPLEMESALNDLPSPEVRPPSFAGRRRTRFTRRLCRVNHFYAAVHVAYLFFSFWNSEDKLLVLAMAELIQ
ncbi:hypothetical protein M0R45_016867 [Rubus argutus]|uniref:Secreted protein n=1 Tax=Rubus argutus TaxID=59490 RepID=A0AAW1XVB0_RUBAR